MNTWNYLKKRTYRAGRRTQECQEFHTFSANSGMSGISHLIEAVKAEDTLSILMADVWQIK